MTNKEPEKMNSELHALKTLILKLAAVQMIEETHPDSSREEKRELYHYLSVETEKYLDDIDKEK